MTILTLALAAVCMPHAAAQPYFRGYATPVALPGGDSGLLRRLHGEGSAVADPVRAVVTDKNGGVRALGPVGYAMEHFCSWGSCRVYVYGNTSLLPEVYRFDLASTKSTDVLSAAGGADALDTVMRAEDTYGFVPVPDLSARLSGALSCLMQWWPSFVILLLIGGGAVPVWLSLGQVIRLRQKSQQESQRGLVMNAFFYAGLIALPAIGLYGLFLFLTAYPPLLSLVAISIPTVVSLLYLMVPNGGGPAPA